MKIFLEWKIQLEKRFNLKFIFANILVFLSLINNNKGSVINLDEKSGNPNKTDEEISKIRKKIKVFYDCIYNTFFD